MTVTVTFNRQVILAFDGVWSSLPLMLAKLAKTVGIYPISVGTCNKYT